MKEFHIVSIGNSLIKNFTDHDPGISSSMKSRVWNDLINDSAFLDRMQKFLEKDPMKYSAEINSLFHYCKKKRLEPIDVEIFPVATTTPSNEIALSAISKYLHSAGISVYSPKQFSGYFGCREGEACESFTKGMIDLLDKMVYIVSCKKEEGYHVSLNATGGFKAYVITLAMVGFMTQSEVYYMHEEFNDVIIFPSLFHFPNKREMELISLLSRNVTDCNDLFRDFSAEISLLSRYHILKITGPGAEPRIELTNIGRFIAKSKIC